MRFPELLINTKKIQHNAQVVSTLLGEKGMSLVGVAKGTMCFPPVAFAMLSGGARAIGDSRILNLKRLRESGYQGETVLLRAPGPSECEEACMWADVSLVSTVLTAELLGESARKLGKKHKVVLMIDLGDLREGVLVEDAVQVAKEMSRIKGIEFLGIGTNLACYGGVIPTIEKMNDLLAVKRDIENALGRELVRVSGGNSANMLLVINDQMPRGITELRIGESILLGTEAVKRTKVPGCFQDAFLVRAEVIEVLRKPSKPFGEIGQDAFGHVPHFEDRGIRRRAICAIGRQDIDPDGLTPVQPGITVLGASSDHLLLDVEDAEEEVKVGMILDFLPNYSALLRASTSPFVRKEVVSHVS